METQIETQSSTDISVVKKSTDNLFIRPSYSGISMNDNPRGVSSCRSIPSRVGDSLQSHRPPASIFYKE